ncbi:hypothetical protein LIER_30575 [Lithospermum erythrorhizon]|uniref:Uncharacterized protein n=1 Tax=Lithospermum erythrorhizon TaxID=34254 RepID=A0AAV3RRR9_LITER
MESWGGDNLFPHGNPLIGKTHRVNKDYFKTYLIAYYNNQFWWKWEAKLANQEDRQAILKMIGRKWFREVDDLEDSVFSDDSDEEEENDDDDDDEDGDDDDEWEDDDDGNGGCAYGHRCRS